MTGHAHDLDLVAGLAGGLLDPAEEEEALRLVTSCDVCRHEYGVQQRIREGLAALPPPALTETERETIVSAARRRRSLRPGPILAAAAAVVVVAVGITAALDGDGSEAAPVVDLGDVTAVELAAELDRLVAEEAGGEETTAFLEERAEPEAAGASAEPDTESAGGAEEEAPPPEPPCEAPPGSTVTVLAVVDGRELVAFVSPDGAVLLDAGTCAPVSPP